MLQNDVGEDVEHTVPDGMKWDEKTQEVVPLTDQELCLD